MDDADRKGLWRVHPILKQFLLRPGHDTGVGDKARGPRHARVSVSPPVFNGPDFGLVAALNLDFKPSELGAIFVKGPSLDKFLGFKRC